MALDLGGNTSYSSGQTRQPSSGFYGLGSGLAWVGDTLGIPRIGISDAIAGQHVGNYWNTVQASPYTAPNASVWSGTGQQIPRTSTPASQPFSYNGSQPNNFNSPTGTYNLPSEGVSAPPDYVSQLRSQIDSMYNSLASGLDPQRAAQESIINNNYGQSLSDLQANQKSGNALLDTQARKTTENQVKTLNDLTENIRNQMQAGNIFLGTRGAGDSSAANQYSYALTALGNKNRGNVLAQANSIMGDIGDKRAQLQQVFTQESSRLATEKNNSLQQLAGWYADAQNQIRQLRGQAQVSASQQVLNAALGALQSIDSQAQAKTSALQSWVVNNAKSLEQALSQMNTVSSYQAPNLIMGALNGQPQFGAQAGGAIPIGMGQSGKTWNPFTQKYE